MARQQGPQREHGTPVAATVQAHIYQQRPQDCRIRLVSHAAGLSYACDVHGRVGAWATKRVGCVVEGTR